MDPIQTLYHAFLKGAAICTDTRKIEKGCIFFALKGANFNGNTFAKQAVAEGAAYAVIDESIGMDNEVFVRVEDVLTCLQNLALHHRLQLKIPFIGITGSNGKTTTKELVSRVLSQKFNTLYTQGNLNNHIGVPLTLLSVKSHHEIAVIEMGANHQKEIELLCSIARPTHVLITNVGKAHLEGFGGFEGVKKGKGEMYDFAKANNALAFINDDNSILKEMLGSYELTFKYGQQNTCDVIGKLLSGSAYVNLEWKKKNDLTYHTIQSKITGSYNFENILSAIAVGVHFNIETANIKKAVEEYIPDNQRSQEIIIGSKHIILDAYNANPTSMEAAIKNFNTSFKGKRAVFLGDMLELGETSLSEHQSVLNLASNCGFDTLVFVGPNFKLAGKGNNAFYFDNSNEAREWIRSQNLDGYTILIKGSRGSKMELLLEAFQ